MSTLFKPIQTTDALLDSIPIVAGKFIICVDSGKTYIDTAHAGSVRRVLCTAESSTLINCLQLTRPDFNNVLHLLVVSSVDAAFTNPTTIIDTTIQEDRALVHICDTTKYVEYPEEGTGGHFSKMPVLITMLDTSPQYIKYCWVGDNAPGDWFFTYFPTSAEPVINNTVYAPITRTAIAIENFEQMADPPAGVLEPYTYEIDGYVIATHIYPDIDATVLEQLLTTIEYNATTYKSTIRIHGAVYGELYPRYMTYPTAGKHYVYADVIKDVSAAYDPSSLTTLTGNSVVLSPFGRYRWTASGICELTASDEWLSSGFETALIIITYETGAVLTINGITVADEDELTAPGVYTCYVENQDGMLLFKVV